MTDPAVEAVAAVMRAIHATEPGTKFINLPGAAQAAIAAYRSWQAEQGLVEVPRPETCCPKCDVFMAYVEQSP